MLCDHCHKREAVVHLQEIRPDGKSTLKLCLPCMIKKMTSLQDSFKAIGTGTLPPGLGAAEGLLNQIPKELLEQAKRILAEEEAADRDCECPTCHRQLDEFTKDWQLGCEDCAEAFADALKKRLERIHNCALPPMPLRDKTTAMGAVEQIQHELENAVKHENFERAAYLRDLLNEYKSASANTKED